mgnify:CR=1 FL=1
MKEHKKDILLCIGLSAAVTVIALVIITLLYGHDYGKIANKIVPSVYIILQMITSFVMTMKTKKSMLCPLSQLVFTTTLGILAPILLIALGSFASRFDIRFLKDLFAMFFGPAIFSGFVAVVYLIEYAVVTTTSFVFSTITALITGGLIKISEKNSERKI